MQEVVSEAQFLAYADALRAQDPALSPIMAGIVAAVFQGIADDSRSFSKLFGIAHALVLREINQLSGLDAPVEIIGRDARTQRTYIKLTVKGAALCARVP